MFTSFTVNYILQHMCSFFNICVVKIFKMISWGDEMYYNEKIAFERDKQNITQKEMAYKLGIKQQQYARYEKGINVMPVTYLPKICKILNVSADYILGLTEYKFDTKK